MAFSRKKIEERKAWLRGFVPGTYLDHTASDISYTDFVNKVSYSNVCIRTDKHRFTYAPAVRQSMLCTSLTVPKLC